MRQIILCLLLGWSLGLSQAALTADAPAIFDDPADQARYTALLGEIRCLVCQNQSLADSDAELAGDLRGEIQRLIGDGANDAQVEQFLVERYGDFVLYRPRFKPLTWALWLGPLLLLIIAASVIGRLVRQRAQLPPPELTGEQREQAARLLDNDTETP